ncbi:MAG: TIR domain-containing protein [Chloroflexota bacterium]|nr:TIR domain-containing protein [Chloroflexota bacterium]
MSTQSNARPARIFLAFTSEDGSFHKDLVTQLASLRQGGIIDNWHEYEIPVAEIWQQVEKERLTQADIILLLISPDFIASDYYYSVQMKQALERNAAGDARVIPILCRPVYLEDLPIARLPILPRSDLGRIKAVSEWENKDSAYAEIVREVREAIAELFGASPPIQVPPQPETASQPQGTRYLTYNGHSSYLISAAWSPDGKYIASGGGDTTVRVWDANTGNTLYTYRVSDGSPIRPNFVSEVWEIIWSPDSSKIAVGGKGIPMVWSPQGNQALATYKGHSPLLRIIASMAWSPDKQYIASTNLGSLADPNIHIWSSTTGQLFTKIRMSFNITITIGGIAWAPDSRRVACGWPGEVRIYDVYTRQLVQTYKNASGVSYFYVRWSRDGSRLVCAVPKEAVVWDTTTGRLLHKYVAHKDDIRDLAISPDGKHVASASNDKTVHIWETDTAKRIFTYEGHKDQVASVTWSPDGKRVASASKDGTVHVWQAL